MTADLLATYRIGSTTVEVWSTNVRTLFDDGTEVVGAPNAGETLQDTIDHELGHTWLAVHQDGLPWSPVMWNLAHGDASPSAAAGAEERRVLDWQATLRWPRPWDRNGPPT